MDSRGRALLLAVVVVGVIVIAYVVINARKNKAHFESGAVSDAPAVFRQWRGLASEIVRSKGEYDRILAAASRNQYAARFPVMRDLRNMLQPTVAALDVAAQMLDRGDIMYRAYVNVPTYRDLALRIGYGQSYGYITGTVAPLVARLRQLFDMLIQQTAGIRSPDIDLVLSGKPTASRVDVPSLDDSAIANASLTQLANAVALVGGAGVRVTQQFADQVAYVKSTYGARLS